MDSKTQSKTKELEESYHEHLLFLGFLLGLLPSRI